MLGGVGVELGRGGSVRERIGCSFFAYSWRGFLLTMELFLLTIDNSSFFTYKCSFSLTALASLLKVGAFLLTVGKCV